MSSTGSMVFAAGLRSDAVSNATGRGWQEWFHLLDSAGANSLAHADIERYLYEKEGLSNWWSRMVTIGYEQACGKRIARMQPKSAAVLVSASFNSSSEEIFKAWANEGQRARWLPGTPILIRKAVANHALRITWTDEISGLVVEIFETGPHSCRVDVRHVNLAPAQTEEMRVLWLQALDRLAGLF